MEKLSLKNLEFLDFSEMAEIEAGSGGWNCAAGIIGGGIVGGLGGAAAGSVVPWLGTIAGGIWGVVGGGLSGFAANC